MNLLRNFCCQPRTAIRWKILPLKPVMVRFYLNDDLRLRLSNLLNNRLFTLEDIEHRAAELVPILDHVWEACSLHGAILLSPWRDEHLDLFTSPSGSKGIQKVLCPVNPLLVLNVLCRSRAGLLLPNMPLSIEVPFLTRDFLSADPRLVELAEEDLRHERK